jgi:hypothetical protein
MKTFNALEMAKRKWNHCTISGTGNIAVVLGCCYRVVLVEIPIQAQALANDRCSPNCSHTIAPHGGWHQIHVLRPPEPHRPRLRGNFAAFMEQD